MKRATKNNLNYLEHLIDMALADGELTEKEKQTITYRINMTVFQEFLAGIAAAFGTGGRSYENQ